MPLLPDHRRCATLLGASLLLAVSACAPARQATPAPAPATASTAAPSPTSPMPADDGARAQCSADATTRFVGRMLDATIERDARAAAGARTVRVIRPGMAVTMDYREDRLNIEVDDAGRIERLHCG